MLRNKKVLMLVALIGLIVFLSGCTQMDQPITPESTGIWNKYFVYPLSQVITFFAELFNSSYGLAIVVVTLIIRLVLVPLNIKQIKSSKAMQEIQPKLQELQKKYSSKDANTQQKLQQETMELLQRNSVNQLAGCLPIFVQMPVLIPMFHAIIRTTEISQYNFLWFELGSPDYVLPFLVAGFTFPQQKIMMSTNTAASQNPQLAMQMNLMLY